MRRLIQIVTALLALSLMAGCSSGSKSTRNADYRQAKTLPPLEVPPDLTRPVERGDTSLPALGSTRSVAEVAETGSGTRVLPAKRNVEVKGKGDQRWLWIDAAPEEVWGGVRDFWLKNGFELKIDEPAIGIMETQWSENRADIPEGFLRKWLGRLYSASTRDKFRVRLERTDTGTELFLTHYGVEEVVTEQHVGGGGEVIWRPRPSDFELTQEMLNRVMVHLGVDAEQSGRLIADIQEEQPRAELVKGGSELQVVVYESFARAWRRTGIALDRIGFVVEDRDRSEGVYYVRYVDQLADAGKKAEKGWFGGLFGGDDDDDGSPKEGEKARVMVRGDDRETRIVLLGAEGDAADPRHAETVLARLAQQLR